MKVALYVVILAFVVSVVVILAVCTAQVCMGIVHPNVAFVATCAVSCVFGAFVRVN